TPRHRNQNARAHTETARCGRLNSRSRKRDEICHVAPIKRQIENALGFDDLSDACAARFHLRGICLYFDLFGNLSDFQRWIHDRAAVDLQDDSCLYERTETR